MTRRIVLALSIGLVAGACSEATDPTMTPVSHVEGPPGPIAERGPSPPPTPHMLRQLASAPPLALYEVGFWVVQGKSQRVRIRYAEEGEDFSERPSDDYFDNDDSAWDRAVQFVGTEKIDVGSGEKFLELKFHKRSLGYRPDGSAYKKGDAVFVTVSIDPVEFRVEFGPSGTIFNPNEPPRLRIWYGNADPDLNGDGVVNWKDAITTGQLVLWGQASAEPWSKIQTAHGDGSQVVSTLLDHFSNYAVAW